MLLSKTLSGGVNRSVSAKCWRYDQRNGRSDNKNKSQKLLLKYHFHFHAPPFGIRLLGHSELQLCWSHVAFAPASWRHSLAPPRSKTFSHANLSLNTLHSLNTYCSLSYIFFSHTHLAGSDSGPLAFPSFFKSTLAGTCYPLHFTLQLPSLLIMGTSFDHGTNRRCCHGSAGDYKSCISPTQAPRPIR